MEAADSRWSRRSLDSSPVRTNFRFCGRESENEAADDGGAGGDLSYERKRKRIEIQIFRYVLCKARHAVSPKSSDPDPTPT